MRVSIVYPAAVYSSGDPCGHHAPAQIVRTPVRDSNKAMLYGVASGRGACVNTGFRVDGAEMGCHGA